MSRKIYNEISLIWNEDTNSYDTISEDSFYYDGEIYGMQEGEIEITGGETAGRELKKVSTAAKKVAKEFDGYNKVTLKNVDILKQVIKASDGVITSVKAIVKENQEAISKAIQLKNLREFEAKEKKKLADLNRKDQQSKKASNKLINQQIEAERKLKALNIKREIKDRAEEEKKHLKIIKKHVAQSKKEAAQRKRNRAVKQASFRALKKLNEQLKLHNVSLKSLEIPMSTYQKALKGDKLALDRVTRATKELVRTGEIHGKQVKGFNVRNHRNAMSLSKLRSQILMAAFAYNTLLRPLLSVVEAAGVQERAERSVAAALKSTAGASNMTQGEIVRHAAAIEELTGVGDELVLGSSALLLTFTSIGRNVFPEAQTAIVNLASAMNLGVASSESLKSATILVGKALNAPLTGLSALTRVGIQFTEQQKEQIKSFSDLGETQKAQEVILEELTTQYGEFAEAIRHTHEGRVQALKSALGTLAEEMGKALLPALTKIIEGMISLAKSFSPERAKRVLAIVSALGAMVAVYKLLNLNLKKVISRKKIELALESALSITRLGVIKGLAAAAAGYAVYRAVAGSGQEEINGLSKEELDLIEEKKRAEALARGEKLKGSIKDLEAAEKSIKSLEKRLELINANSEVDKHRINQGRELLDQEIELLEKIEKQTAAKKLAQDIEQSEEKLLKKLQLSASMSDIERFRIEQGRELSDLEIQYLQSLEAIKIAKDEELEKEKELVRLRKERAYQDKLGLDIESSTLALSQEAKVLQAKISGASEIDLQRMTLKNQKVLALKKNESEVQAIEEKANLLTGEALDKQLKMINDKNAQKELIREIFNLQLDSLDIDEKALELQKKKAVQQQLFNIGLQIANEGLGALRDSIEAEKQILDTKMQEDIDRVKKTGEYQMAAKYNNEEKMQQLEKAARKKTLKDRQKAFKQMQAVSISEILMNTGVAMLRAYKDYDAASATVISGMLAALGATQIARVAAQEGPKFARGGDFVTSGPQTITVGDNPGGRERVQVTPLSSPNFDGPRNNSNINITFTGNVMSRDFIEDEAIPQIKDAIRRGADIGIG